MRWPKISPKIKLVGSIAIPLVFLLVVIRPLVFPPLQTVSMEVREMPTRSYSYNPETNGDDAISESAPAERSSGTFIKAWRPFKRFLAETKEILSTIALFLQVGKMFNNRRKRRKK